MEMFFAAVAFYTSFPASEFVSLNNDFSAMRNRKSGDKKSPRDYVYSSDEETVSPRLQHNFGSSHDLKSDRSKSLSSTKIEITAANGLKARSNSNIETSRTYDEIDRELVFRETDEDDPLLFPVVSRKLDMRNLDKVREKKNGISQLVVTMNWLLMS
jgi:hypothetical protein